VRRGQDWKVRFGAVALLLALPLLIAAAPRRIVSLNPCTDAILLDVADPGQIAALSWWSRSPAEFALADQARAFRHVRGDAETVATLHPDLVLTGGGGGAPLQTALARLRIASADFSVPETIADSLAQVRRVARLSGQPGRGEAMVRRIQAALRAAAPRPGERRLSALVFEANGFVSGPDTLASELMARAGFDNVAVRYGLRRSADLPLEKLVLHPPQVVLSGRLPDGEPAWADRVLSHPALKRLGARVRVERFPQPLLFCAGPVLIPAVGALARARRDAEAPPP
jgi:iron complex transport system substrate-binding protein